MTINSVSGLIDWTPTNSQVGEQTVTVIVTDLGGLTATQPLTIIVTNVNGAPSFTSDPILNTTAELLYSYNVDAVDDDLGDILTYSLFVSPINMSIDGVTGLIEWTPNANEIGNHDITVQVTDLDGLVASQSFVLVVSAAINDVGPVRTYLSGAGPHPLGTTTVTIEIATDVVATCRLNNVDDNNPVGWTTQLTSTNGTSHTSDITLVNDEDTTRYIICRESASTVVNGIAFVFDIVFESAVNQAPTITSINDQTVTESSATNSLNFTVDDAESAASSLIITSSSSNTVLVPSGNIVLSGSDANRSVIVTPAADESGSATISLTVSDGELTVVESFVVTVTSVNDAPTITAINNQTVNEDNATSSLSFTIADTETAASSLTITSSSSDTVLVPLVNIVLSGSGASRSVIVTPTANENGSATITLAVSDGELTTEESFVVTVTSVNDTPTITAINDQTVTESNPTSSLSFTVDDEETTAGSLIVTSSSSNTTLVPTANIVISGNDASRSVIVTPVTNESGSATITLTVSDGELTAVESFVVTVTAVNDAPTITAINNQTVNEDTATSSLSFTVSDTETAANSLTVTSSSSNTILVPSENVVLSGSGADRSVVVTPVANESGSATITVTVSDGVLTASTSFVVTVSAINDAPTITAINNQTVNEDTATNSLSFTVDDIESAASSLTVTSSSSNTILVPSSNIVLSGSGASRSVIVTPADNESGSATITLTVSDGTLTTNETFVVTVTSVDDAPTITAINNQTIDEDNFTSSLSFTVDDEETAASSLIVTSTSSNTILVPSGNIVLSGSGSSRSVIVTPFDNESGSATITLTVSDGTLTSEESFVVTVTSVNDSPTITTINNQTIDEDNSTSSLSFTVDDEETAASSLTVTSSSSNTILVPAGNIVLSGSGASRSVIVTPAANQNGSATITLTVSDGSFTSVETFVVTVTAVNDLPTLTSVGNQAINQNEATGSLSFTVGDVETALNSLTVTSSSDNTALVPSSNITLSGSGANRLVQVTPASNKNGSATITLTVTDGNSASQSSSFLVSVNAPPTVDAGLSQTVSKDAVVSLTATATDLDGSITAYAWEQTAGSTVSFSGADTATLSFTAPNFTVDTALSFSVTVTDDGNLTASDSVTVTVEGSIPDWANSDVVSIADGTTNNSKVIPENGLIGSLEGQGGVSGGSASYSIPIALPPGRAGMQPSVSLSYSSRGGNGVVGMGWSLGIGSAISRCARTEAQDDRIGGVTYHNTTDRVCLNGQRLISVSGSTTTAEYRTEIDSFQKINQIGNLNDTSSRFEVISKGGLTQYFGTTSNSRVIPSGAPATLTWQLEKEQDQSGNTIEYIYEQNADGEVLLEEVLYTGYNSTAGDRKVSFEYEARDDRSSSYLSGGLTRQTERLKTIETYYGATLIRRYTLNYSYSLASGKSLLADVEECAYKNSIANCLPITEFNWHNKAIEYEVEKLGYISATTGNLNTQLQSENKIENVMPHGDRDGDGSSDWKTWSMDAEGILTDTHDDDQTTCRYNGLTHSLVCADVDFDRDGKTDSWKIENNILKIALSPNNWQDTLVSANNDSFIKLAADFNGDGWPDLVMHDNPSSPTLTLYTHTQNVSAPYSSNGQVIYSASGTSTDAQFVGDLDGNGLPDFIEGSFSPGFGNGSVPQAIPQTAFLTKLDASNNIYFDTIDLSTHARTGLDYENFFNFFMDVNGDGLTDWLSWKSGNSTSISFNQGDGTFTPWAALGAGASFAVRIAIIDVLGEPFDQNYPKYHASFRVLDINSDGKPELLVPGNRIVEACANLITTSDNGFSNPVVSFCGDELYGTIRTMSIGLQKYETPIQTSLYDDSIYEWDAIYFDENEDGSYTARRESSGLIGSATQSSPISAFGNGLTDFLFTYRTRANEVTLGSGSGTVVGNNYGVYVNRNLGTVDNEADNVIGCEINNSCLEDGDKRYELIDTLKSVVDTAMDIEKRWTYRPLSSRDLDDANNGPLYEVTGFSNTVDAFNFTSSMYVVAAYETSDGIGGFNQTQYRYKDAVYNYKGRGFQGFRTIIVDSPSGIRSVTDFHQMFPLAGKIEAARTCLTTSDELCEEGKLSETTVTNYIDKITANDDNDNDTNPVYWIVPSETIETSYDLTTGNILSQKTVTVDVSNLDNYGNVEYSEQLVDTGLSQVLTKTTNVYDIDESNWWINKLTDSTVKVETTVGSALWDSNLDPIKEIQTIYTYDNTNRKPIEVTVTPMQGEGYATQINTEYNNYGLPTFVTTQKVDGSEMRSITTTYSNDGESLSEDGYFVYEIINDLGHSVTSKTFPEHGQVKSILDANDLLIETAYDAFGRIEQVTPPVGTGQPAYSRFADCSGGCDEITSITPTDITDVSDMASLVAYKLTTYTAGAPETTLYKDQFNRVLFVKTQGFDGSPIFTRVEYDHLGRKRFESVPSFLVDENSGVHYQSFDEQGRLLQKKIDEPSIGGSPQSFTVTYSYSDHQTTIQAVGTTKTLKNMTRTYNGIGQLMRTIDAIGGVTEYAYDAMGNPIVLQDALGNAITAEYNALGQKKYVIDPNMGQKDFTYSDFGEVESETDANGDTYRYAYDDLGRLTSRSLNNQVEASFTFDGVCKGALDKETLTDSNAFQKDFGYDSYCRPISSTTTIDGATFTQTTQYDSYYGRVKGGQTVSGLILETLYNDYGYATHSQNAASGYIYQEIEQMNARAQLTQAKKANGILNEVLQYTHETGQMESIWTDTVAGGNQRHRINYEYDDFGNLDKQTVENLDSELNVITSVEDYIYDDLHRLTNSSQTIDKFTVVGDTINSSINYTYDAVGNILDKDDYGSGFVYGDSNKTTRNAGPNAILSMNKNTGGTAEYTYDNNGNMLLSTVDSTTERTLTYNAFNKPLTITKNSITSTFSYGASQMRYKQVKTNGIANEDETTLYIDKAYEEITQNGVTKKRSYLGDAILTETIGGTDDGFKIGFVHRDRLNSTVTITDENGNVVDNKSFDPFGKPREGTFKRVDSDSIEIPTTLEIIRNLNGYEEHTNRGFTDHEHLDDAELIHMNGRVYDYNLGRFLSVDPFIQDSGNSQSMNPYSYILNNPLSGTDPSGYMRRKQGFSQNWSGGNTNINKVKTKDIKKITVNKDTGNVRVQLTNGNVVQGTVSKPKNVNIGSQSQVAKNKPGVASVGSGAGGDVATAVIAGGALLGKEAGKKVVGALLGGTGVGAVIMGLTPSAVADATQTMDQDAYAEKAHQEEIQGWADESLKEEIRRPTSETLAKTLAAVGEAKPADGYEAHHIAILFGFKNKRAAPTDAMRDLLSAHNIDINGAENLVWLPKNHAARIPGDPATPHHFAHRLPVLIAVNRRLQAGAAAGGRVGVRAALAGVKSDLRSGTIFW